MPNFEDAWGVNAQEDRRGRLRYSKLHYFNRFGETACGKEFRGQFEHEFDAPPGMKRCKKCEERWATW